MKENKHIKKASDTELIKKYKELNSVWKVARHFGMCGQSVHERLVRLGIVKHINKITKEDLEIIRNVYLSGISKGDNKLKLLSEKINRTIPFISRQAKKMGLTTYSHNCTKEFTNSIKKRMSNWIKTNRHPKGMLGKKHKPEIVEKIKNNFDKWRSELSLEDKAKITMKAIKTKVKRYGNSRWFNPRNKSSWRAAWRIVGHKKIFFRSRWEYNYAVYLQYLKEIKQIKKWEHEPKTFFFEKIKRGTKSYLPDFRVTLNNGNVEYHEVKGWYDKASQIKTKRMRIYYPEVVLKMIFSKDYLKLEKEYADKLPKWELKENTNTEEKE